MNTESGTVMTPEQEAAKINSEVRKIESTLLMYIWIGGNPVFKMIFAEYPTPLTPINDQLRGYYFIYEEPFFNMSMYPNGKRRSINPVERVELPEKESEEIVITQDHDGKKYIASGGHAVSPGFTTLEATGQEGVYEIALSYKTREWKGHLVKLDPNAQKVLRGGLLQYSDKREDLLERQHDLKSVSEE